MAEQLFEEFELFYSTLPSNVRGDLSFLLTMLSNENLIFHEPAEIYEFANHELSRSVTRVGRLGNLIYAVSVLDVYFAMNVRDRFGADGGGSRPKGTSGSAGSKFYAREIEAIQTAKRRWQELRATKFTPEAIAAALIPPGPARQKTQTSGRSSSVLEASETLHDAIS